MFEKHLQQIMATTNAICLISGNSYLFGIGNSINVAKWLCQNRYIIYGFEGFKTDGFFIEPSLNHIADFSGLEGNEKVKKSYELSERILCEWQDERNIEFVEFTVKKARDASGK
jgi:hypothetical protein